MIFALFVEIYYILLYLSIINAICMFLLCCNFVLILQHFYKAAGRAAIPRAIAQAALANRTGP